MLQLTSAKKQYGEHLILTIPQLELPPGIFWLKGTNGSGKSTLLKMIGGLIPFDGMIQLNSVDAKKQTTEYRRLVNYAEAEPLYPSFLNGLDLISFFSDTRKANQNATNELIEAFGIQSFIKNSIGTYSSGMLKKLSLVLAFIGHPKLILLDEPLVTIDKESVPILYSLVKKYSDEGVSFIFTSHQAFEATNLSPIKELEVKNNQVCFL